MRERERERNGFPNYCLHWEVMDDTTLSIEPYSIVPHSVFDDLIWSVVLTHWNKDNSQNHSRWKTSVLFESF